MKFNLKAFLFSLAVILIAVLVFSFNIIEVSEKETEIESIYLQDSVSVYETINGIPHIIANNESDLYFTTGYVHARDRMWQMDFMRRFAEGRLSEIFGAETLKEDLFIRSIDIKNIALKSYQNLSDKSLEILNSYSKGINEYLSENNKLSFEFGALGYKPNKWEPYHSILIMKLFSFEMSFSFWTDYMYSMLSTKVNNISDYIPAVTPLMPNIFKENNYISQLNQSNSLNINLPMIDKNLFKNLSNFSQMGFSGSNSWSFRYKNNGKFKAILANDPHLTLQLPSRWYQLHQTADSLNAIGYTIPGVPNILIGRNNDISWGVTNMMADICDIYLVKNEGEDYYINENGKKTEYKYTKDTVFINGKDSYKYYKKSTYLSPVLSKNHLWNTDTTNIEFFDKYDICFDWIGKNISDEISCAYNLNRASNWRSFKSAIKNWNSPPLILNYADKEGNIGITAVGNIPKRNKTNANQINPLWKKEYRWKGIINTSNHKEIYNPGKGFVSSANNYFQLNNQFISDHWEPFSRSYRIIQLLKDKSKYSVRDFQLMQTDLFSPYAELLSKNLVKVLNDRKSELNDLESRYLINLAGWNYNLSKDNQETLVYTIFKKYLVEELFKDETGKELFNYFVFMTNIPDRLILNTIENPNISFVDNKKTKSKESLEDIYLYSFKKAVNEILENNYDKLSEYKYVELKHIFSRNEFLKPSVTLGKFPIGGDNTSLFNTETRYNNHQEVVISASMRFIADMSEEEIYTILPGGSSGSPMSANYGDQVQLWLNGGYLSLPSSHEKNPGASKTINFSPKID